MRKGVDCQIEFELTEVIVPCFQPQSRTASTSTIVGTIVGTQACVITFPASITSHSPVAKAALVSRVCGLDPSSFPRDSNHTCVLRPNPTE